jgi:uncharacterized protein
MPKESQRVEDGNGWFEVNANPLSKVGVFDYSGKSISPDLDPSTMFKVYRPREELADPECIESFKLVPWINDHPKVLLGDPEIGGVAPEQKGVEGVIGERVFFDELDQILKGNIKVFSQTHAQRIADGKEELSVGYRCKYEYSPGIWNGIAYHYVQREIRGNHVASVNAGRMGPDVAVMDSFNFAIDAKEFTIMAAPKKLNKVSALLATLLTFAHDAKEEAEASEAGETSEIKQLMTLIDQVAPLMTKLSEMPAVVAAPSLAEDDDTSMDEAGKMAKDAEEKAAKDAAEAAEADKDKKGAGMDAKEVSELVAREVAKALATHSTGMDAQEMVAELGKRDALAARLSHFVGTFDASEMTHASVAAYGAKKLNIPAVKGSEIAAVTAYLHDRVIPTQGKQTAAMDDNGQPVQNFVQKHLSAVPK